jgi:S1-C subfamily serine protease
MDARFCANCGHVFSAAPAPLATFRLPQWFYTRVYSVPVWTLLAGGSGAILVLLLLIGAVLIRGRNTLPTTPIATVTANVTRAPTEIPTEIPTALPATLEPTRAPSPLPSSTFAPTATVTPIPTFDANAARERALRATVKIIVQAQGRSFDSVTGSGSVITRRGYILTNNHLFYDDNGRPYNAQFEALIAFPPRGDMKSDAQIQYRAVLVENDAERDLALLRLTARRNGGALPATLELETIPIGDSDAVNHGDILTIVGYPGIGGDSLTLTSGNVSGFLEREGWIKTDAEINQGNSGGPALNANYELIGVASAASQADQFDLQGKLGLVRPIKFASALIDRAKRESGE